MQVVRQDCEDCGGDPATAARIVDAEFHALRAEQATWPEVTDNDRLDAACAALSEHGIVVRQNFTCCGSCRNYEVVDEVRLEEGNGRTVRGYAFFHKQGTEGAIDGHTLNFSDGSVKPDATKDDHVSIGRILAEKMEAAGLKVDWNGRLSMCVMVDLDWKRRWGAPAKWLQRA